MEKSRYNDEELAEFKKVILKKMDAAKVELKYLSDALQKSNANGTDDTGSEYRTLEDGSSTLQKEQISKLASRQRKFIQNLEAALVRIENKTYGICRITGNLISKERLFAVPHTTQSIEAKRNQYK